MRIRKSGNFSEEIEKIDAQIEKYYGRIAELKAAKQEYLRQIEKEEIENIKDMMNEMGLSVDELKKLIQEKIA